MKLFVYVNTLLRIAWVRNAKYDVGQPQARYSHLLTEIPIEWGPWLTDQSRFEQMLKSKGLWSDYEFVGHVAIPIDGAK